MSAGSDMVVVVIFVPRRYFLSRFLSQNWAPRDHPQMARAFSCVTLLPHYIGYVYVLYVNDLNRHARRTRAKISRENQFRTCPQREHVSFSHSGQRTVMGLPLKIEPNSKHARDSGVFSLNLSPSSNGKEPPHGISIPASLTDATPIPSGLCSAGTGKAIESPGAAYRQSLPAWAMPPANASRNNFVFGPMGGGALVEDRRARRVREGMVSVRRGLM